MSEDRCDLLCLDAPLAEGIRGALLEENAAREAADLAKALSDPTRLTLAAACGRRGARLVGSCAYATWPGSPPAPKTSCRIT